MSPNKIKWFAGWDIRAFPQRGMKPYNMSPQLAQRLSNGHTLICECWDVIEVTPDLKIVWQFGEWPVNGDDDEHLNQASSAWYYEDTGKVIIADTKNDRILEVDKETKKIARRLTGLNQPVSAFLNPDNGHLIVAEAGTHYVYEIDWQGQIEWGFGIKGEQGSDDKHLREPWFAHPAKSGWQSSFDSVLISDYGNNRVILVRKQDQKIVKKTLSCGPEMAMQTYNLGVAVTSQIAAFVGDQDWDVRWYAPHNWRIIPTPDNTYILIDRVNLIEIDPCDFLPQPTLPGSFRLLTEYQLEANKSVGPIESEAAFKDIPPVPVFTFKGGFTVYVKTTQPAKLTILTAKTKWSCAPTVQFDDWQVYEEDISLGPDRLYCQKITDDHTFIGLKITMGETAGIIDTWLTWK